VLLTAVAVAAVTTGLWRRSEDNARRLEARRLYQIAERTLNSSPPKALAYSLAPLELTDGFAERRLALKAAWRSPMPFVVDRYGLPTIVIGADFSPDGRWLAVGHMNQYLALWRESGGAEIGLKTQAGHPRGYFAPDGNILFSWTARDPRYIAWSVPDLRRLGAHEAPPGLGRVRLNARNGNILRGLARWERDPSAPGGWKLDLRAREWVERLDLDRCPAAALAPDGRQLIYAVDETLHIAQLDRPGAAPTELLRCRSGVEHVIFNPHGDRLATAHVGGALRMWSFSGDAVSLLREWDLGTDETCHDLRFDPTGSLLVAGFDGWDTAVRQIDEPPGADPLWLAPAGGRVAEVDFHPDGPWLAIASLRRVSLWPLGRARHPYVLRGHSGRVERVAFAPDGSWLASCGTDGTVRRWPLEATAGEIPRVLFDWGHPIQFILPGLAMSPDGRFVVATGGEDSARLVSTDGSPAKNLGPFDRIAARAAVGRGGRTIAVKGVAGEKKVIRLWDLDTDTVSDIVLDGPSGGAMNLQALVGGQLLVATEKRSLLRIDPDTGRITDLAEGIQDFAADRDGTVVLSRTHFDGKPSVATVHDMRAGSHTPLDNHGTGVVSLALDSSGTIVVTGSRDGIVRVGPVSGETPRWLVGHDGIVVSVAVSPDGRRIASAGNDGTIRLWPMPDLSSPPLHDLPRAEFIARLGALTNLRVVRDPDDPEGYLVRAGPFPGWQTAPEW
jgi:WD40 repeat protein